MAKKSFWKRGEDYAKKVSGELIEQIKAGSGALAEAVEAGRADQRRKLLDRQEVHRREQPLPDEPGVSGMDGAITVGEPTTRSGKRAARFARARKGRRFCFSRIARPRPQRTRKGKPLKDKEGKTIYEEEQRSHPICKQYTVFNVEQADGIGIEAARRPGAARMGRSPGRRESDRGQRAVRAARRQEIGPTIGLPRTR